MQNDSVVNVYIPTYYIKGVLLCFIKTLIIINLYCAVVKFGPFVSGGLSAAGSDGYVSRNLNTLLLSECGTDNEHELYTSKGVLYP